MKVEQLQQVLEIVATGSMTAAAQSLYMSQSSLSVSIKNLETELRNNIFDRSRHTLTLTPFGKEFLQYARVVCAQINALSNIEDPVKPALSFRVVSQFFRFPQTLFGDLYVRHANENIIFKFDDCSFMDVLEKVSQNEADIGILTECKLQQAMMKKLYKSYHLSYHELYAQPLTVIVGQGSPLYSQESDYVSVEELMHYPFVLFSDLQYGFASEWEYLGLKDHTNRILVSNQIILFQLLASTNAFAISMYNPAFYKSGNFFQGVRNLFIKDCSLEVGVGYVVPTDSHISDITKEYIDMLEKAAK